MREEHALLVARGRDKGLGKDQLDQSLQVCPQRRTAARQHKVVRQRKHVAHLLSQRGVFSMVAGNEADREFLWSRVPVLKTSKPQGEIATSTFPGRIGGNEQEGLTVDFSEERDFLGATERLHEIGKAMSRADIHASRDLLAKNSNVRQTQPCHDVRIACRAPQLRALGNERIHALELIARAMDQAHEGVDQIA
jgi:hypothetical protein